MKENLLCLYGKNGSGKSTLLKTIVGLKKPYKGSISLNIDLSEFSYLEQVNTKNNDFPITVKEVILSGLQRPKKLFYTKEDNLTVINLAKKLKIEEILDKKIGDISGGQKQRAILARSLAKNPKLLILDEPLSGLDSKITKEVLILLKELNKESNITILMSIHDMNLAKEVGTRFIVLDDEKIVFDGISSSWKEV